MVNGKIANLRLSEMAREFESLFFRYAPVAELGQAVDLGSTETERSLKVRVFPGVPCLRGRIGIGGRFKPDGTLTSTLSSNLSADTMAL